MKNSDLLKRYLRRIARMAIARCTDDSHPMFAGCGGRGIAVYEPFYDDVQLFVEYLYLLPDCSISGYVLDRIDNDGHYEPGNLRFCSSKESSINRRSTKHIDKSYLAKVKLNAERDAPALLIEAERIRKIELTAEKDARIKQWQQEEAEDELQMQLEECRLYVKHYCNNLKAAREANMTLNWAAKLMYTTEAQLCKFEAGNASAIGWRKWQSIFDLYTWMSRQADIADDNLMAARIEYITMHFYQFRPLRMAENMRLSIISEQLKVPPKWLEKAEAGFPVTIGYAALKRIVDFYTLLMQENARDGAA